MAFLGPILGGIGALASGVGAIGGLFSGRGGPDVGAQQQFSMQQLQMQEQFQREMAQNSISYRVEDAKRAGVSPLVALGAPTFSPSLSIPAVDYSRGSGADFSGFRSLGGALGDLGKNLTAGQQFEAAQQQRALEENRRQRESDADIALKGAQAAYWSKMAATPMPAVGSGSSGGPLQGQVLDRGFGNAREEIAKISQSGPNVSVESGAGPNSVWKRTGDYTVVRVPRDPVIASASPWNPEYIKWQLGTLHERPPPMEALPPGTVRWIPGPFNQWRAVPYWPGERLGIR